VGAGGLWSGCWCGRSSNRSWLAGFSLLGRQPPTFSALSFEKSSKLSKPRFALRGAGCGLGDNEGKGGGLGARQQGVQHMHMQPHAAGMWRVARGGL
jgi:hypothetical protein